jgi:hypothetical protein
VFFRAHLCCISPTGEEGGDSTSPEGVARGYKQQGSLRQGHHLDTVA